MQNHMAVLDLSMLQCALEEEGMSMEFRHIASYLILYSSHHLCEDLLHMVILCMEYFTLLYPDNELHVFVFRWCCGSCVPCPSSISATPASPLFSSPPLSPAATTTTPNRRILEQELSCVLLANFIEEKQLEQQQAKLAPPGQTGPSRPNWPPPLSRKVRPKTDARAADNCLPLTCRFPQEQCGTQRRARQHPRDGMLNLGHRCPPWRQNELLGAYRFGCRG
ncbi:hypothetical protein ACOMHN_008466 [Nucella lapillus]